MYRSSLLPAACLAPQPGRSSKQPVKRGPPPAVNAAVSEAESERGYLDNNRHLGQEGQAELRVLRQEHQSWGWEQNSLQLAHPADFLKLGCAEARTDVCPLDKTDIVTAATRLGCSH
jgi:hypothetical protein